MTAKRKLVTPSGNLARGRSTRNAKPEEIEAGLEAIVEHGGITPAAEAKGFVRTKLAVGAAKYPDRLDALRTRDGRARGIRRSAVLTRLAEDAEAGRARLRQIVDTSGDADEVARATDSLIRMTATLDGHERLDAGRPTEIAETRDTTSDAELAADLDHMLRDPRLRVVIGKP
mgnify:CR=1 FL=1